jgi:hypothetical protein
MKIASTEGKAMQDEYDFSHGERGKFFHVREEILLPVYLDQSLQLALTDLAKARGVELSVLANTLLKQDIDRLQSSL